MIDRKIELAFDEKKQAARAIRTEILQRSSVLFLLLLIYFQFLFSKRKNEHQYTNIKMLCFIGDVTIEVESKSAKENCKLLIEIVQKVFS